MVGIFRNTCSVAMLLWKRFETRITLFFPLRTRALSTEFFSDDWRGTIKRSLDLFRCNSNVVQPHQLTKNARNKILVIIFRIKGIDILLSIVSKAAELLCLCLFFALRWYLFNLKITHSGIDWINKRLRSKVTRLQYRRWINASPLKN